MRRQLLACLLLLTGCSEPASGPEHLTEYLDRLSTVTGVTLPHANPTSSSLELPRDDGHAAPSASQIDLIDFLSLSGCELQINLGRRNTQLGRTASPSQRLLLDLEFLELAPACINLISERGDTALADTLQQVSVQRRQALPSAVVLAVHRGPEWRQFWEPPAALGLYPDQTSSQVVESLTRLSALTRNWLGDDWRADNREFELLLSDLRGGDGGALLYASDLISRDLGRANQMLDEARAQAPFCPYGAPTERSKILERTVQRFFINTLQPWLVKIRRRKELLLSSTQQLDAPFESALDAGYRRWSVQRDRTLERPATLIREHVLQIQRTLSHCSAG
ncbi:MAG: DUF3080 family protein [Luminiphilus sp.]|nr:DUF3080 family protein [Luminiphilus sp.]